MMKLKIDLVGERITHDEIGFLMTVIHIPMGIFFIYDLLRVENVRHTGPLRDS